MKPGQILDRFLSRVSDTLWPRTCPVCGQPLIRKEDVACVGCMAMLPRTFLHRESFNSIHQRIGKSHFIDVAAAWYEYNPDSPYASLIRNVKYYDMPSLGVRLGEIYAAELLADGFCPPFDIILPVPMYKLKLLKRGYNQSECFARGLSNIWNIPVGDNLIALRGHKTQTRKSGIRRAENVSGVFGIKRPEELDHKHVAIVDDIITTGATMAECVRTLDNVAHISALSVLAIGLTRHSGF